jgi:hypothetical protein
MGRRLRAWLLRRLGVVSPSQAYLVDLRGGCPMDRPGCPGLCSCPVNLWEWARPRMAEAIAAARAEEDP